MVSMVILGMFWQFVWSPPLPALGRPRDVELLFILLLLGAPGAALGRPRGGPGAPLSRQPTRKIFF